jgi:Flp pilus assembly protein TadD
MELTREAADDIDAGDLESAEARLRDALTADLYHGPAHNNLGVVFLEQGKLYEAAQEFEWAKKLLPSAPDPRVNLALVLESAGQEENALMAWESALDVAPGCLQAEAGLERLMAIRGEH